MVLISSLAKFRIDLSTFNALLLSCGDSNESDQLFVRSIIVLLNLVAKGDV